MTIADQELLAQQRRFTREEYYRMWEEGFFHKQRVELIDGKVLLMSPQNDPHASTIVILTHLFVRAVPSEYRVRVQLPLSVSDASEPEPDIAIVKNEPGVKRGEHPCTAKLVIEIADASLKLDRAKASLYASAAVPEYWIIDLNARKLHVYTSPTVNDSEEFGAGYANVRKLDLSDTVMPSTIPMSQVNVSDLFPPA